MQSTPTFSQANAATLARSQALGVVRPPAIPASQIILPQNLYQISVTVGALGKFPVNLPGDFIFVAGFFAAAAPYQAIALSIATALTLKPDVGAAVPLLRIGQRHRFPQAFNFVEISNPNASAVTVTFYIGFGDYTETDSNVIVSSNLAVATGSFTRPANVTAYAVGDIVGTDPAAVGSLVLGRLAGAGGYINRLRLTKSTTSTTNAAFRAYFFTTPPTAVADNLAAAFTLAEMQGMLGILDFPVFTGDGSAAGSFCEISGIDFSFLTTAGLSNSANVYYVLTARAAYTPGNAEVFHLNAAADQN